MGDYYTKKEAQSTLELLKKGKFPEKIVLLEAQKTARIIQPKGEAKQLGYLVHIKLENGKNEYPVNLLGKDHRAENPEL